MIWDGCPQSANLDFHAIHKPFLSGGKELLLSFISNRSNDSPSTHVLGEWQEGDAGFKRSVQKMPAAQTPSLRILL